MWWDGFAEANVGPYHFRIWRKRPDSLDAVTYRSGSIPAGVTGVVGTEQALYGVNSVGHVVRLEQSTKGLWCDRVLDTMWRVTAESGGATPGSSSRWVLSSVPPRHPLA